MVSFNRRPQTRSYAVSKDNKDTSSLSANSSVGAGRQQPSRASASAAAQAVDSASADASELATLKLRLWSSLLFVMSLCPSCDAVQSLCAEMGLHETLNQLLSLSYGWMNLTSINSSAASSISGALFFVYILCPVLSERVYLLLCVCICLCAGAELIWAKSPTAVNHYCALGVNRFAYAYYRSSCIGRVPSEGAIAATALVAAASYVFKSDKCKRLFARSGSARIALLDTGFTPASNAAGDSYLGKSSPQDISSDNNNNKATKGNAMTHLTSLGLNSSIASAGRHLCLSLLTSLVFLENSASLIEKTTIGTTLQSFLQRGMHSNSNNAALGTETMDNRGYPKSPSSVAQNHHTPIKSISVSHNTTISTSPETLFHVIAAWTACLTATTCVDSKGSLTPILDHHNSRNNKIDPSHNKAYLRGGSGSGSQAPRDVHKPVEQAAMSVPELLSWLFEKYSAGSGGPSTTSESVVVQIVRAIGCLSAGPTLIDGAMQSNASSVAHRRMLASAASDSCLSILSDCLLQSSQRQQQIAVYALVTLWTLLHASEQAKSNWKQHVSDKVFKSTLEALFQHYNSDVQQRGSGPAKYLEALEDLVQEAMMRELQRDGGEEDAGESEDFGDEEKRMVECVNRALLALSLH